MARVRRPDTMPRPNHSLDHARIRGASQVRSKLLCDPKEERDACGVGFIVNLHQAGREVLELALCATERLAHRGAVSSDDATGDGAGVLTQIPHAFFAAELERLGKRPAAPGQLAVGFFFMSRDAAVREREKGVVEAALTSEGLPLLAWREVPVQPGVLGDWARVTCPAIWQVLAGAPGASDGRGRVSGSIDFERRVYRARRRLEREALAAGLDEFYVASFSARTIVYKGLFMAHQLAAFYDDLRQPAYATQLAIYHQRYSTNTTPSWRNAQPFRALAHNGEINTLQGNVNWMAAREGDLSTPFFTGDEIRPVIDRAGSDSAALDNALELLALSGRDIRHALMMLVPEAWEGIPDMAQERKDFYRYHACLIEPWDGPAGLAFSDGRIVGVTLDRNGLRPMRYTVTKDGWVIAGSEVGCVPIAPERVERLGRLGPGQMIAVDVESGRLYDNAALKAMFCEGKSYGRWLASQVVSLAKPQTKGRTPERTAALGRGNGHAAKGAVDHKSPEYARQLLQWQAAFGYTDEELTVILRPMVENAKEPVGSMGDDTPHAILSHKPRPLFHYFKQRFAEVTNPPIDHLRERLVFSLRTLLGPRHNLLEERAEHAHLIELKSPVLLDGELDRLVALGEADPAFRTARLSTLLCVDGGREGLEAAVDKVCQQAEAAVDSGAGILILSDRGVNGEQAPIPALMATGAVHHHLIRVGKRMRVSLVVESGEPREIHHVAALLGYGASAVNPYLALATVSHLIAAGRTRHKELTPEEAQERYRKAIEEGLLKVMSKMGISTVDSYTGAQIFEALGLSSHLVDKCFAGTPSRLEGNGFPEIADIVLGWHRDAFGNLGDRLSHLGLYKYTSQGEFHEWSPQAVRALHKAVAIGSSPNGHDPERYTEYKRYVDITHSHPGQLRDLLDFTPDRQPVPVDEVEPAEAIVRRFSTAHMSLGALSPEAHETLAIAMSRLGGRSGSGEGGEEARRLKGEGNSTIKQVASGRFGVTPAYLASALELQIKMAQGSKPGEGGQIPGHKVTDLIAHLRHTVPGVALISPPPHHDIYSIEDLAQLIYDLKRANPTAEVSVKLVCETGVGIVASGVAKGRADIIVLSGHSGGTGSSPLNSIKNAGLPWEVGLAETQQAMLANGLRQRIALRVDGGIRTGRDVVIAALLGADEVSFGTAAMVAEGCLMARTCHTNNCPVGIASQRPELREKFPGKPENVVAYFAFLAQEVREILASLGYRSLDEVIGRTELLRQKKVGNPVFDRLDLAPLLAVPEEAAGKPRRRTVRQNPLPAEERLDDKIIALAEPALQSAQAVQIELPISNTDRTVAATLSWEIARRYGDAGLPSGAIRITLTGTAGQSFGAFNSPGVHLKLIGQANDYVGKGMAGGEIVVRPDPRARFAPHENVIIGNTVLYGATSGQFYAAGRAGERFAVRNSGACAVVEGVGDHGCEYMTSGTVVVLGPTGYNFGAGMTGGEAFVFDPDGRLQSRYNPQLVGLSPLAHEDAHRLHEMVVEHYEKTASPLAAQLLRDWDEAVTQFVRVAPLTEVGAIEAKNEGAMVR